MAKECKYYRDGMCTHPRTLDTIMQYNAMRATAISMLGWRDMFHVTFGHHSLELKVKDRGNLREGLTLLSEKTNLLPSGTDELPVSDANDELENILRGDQLHKPTREVVQIACGVRGACDECNMCGNVVKEAVEEWKFRKSHKKHA